MHTVENNIRLALKDDRRVRATLFWHDTPEEDERVVGDPQDHPPHRLARPRGRQPVARPEAVA